MARFAETPDAAVNKTKIVSGATDFEETQRVPVTNLQELFKSLELLGAPTTPGGRMSSAYSRANLLLGEDRHKDKFLEILDRALTNTMIENGRGGTISLAAGMDINNPEAKKSAIDYLITLIEGDPNYDTKLAENLKITSTNIFARLNKRIKDGDKLNQKALDLIEMIREAHRLI